MVIVNPANEALRSARNDAVDKKGSRGTHVIAIIPEENERYSVVLVDCSTNDSRYISEVDRTSDVAKKDIQAAIRDISVGLNEDEGATKLPLVFFNLDHEGDYRRCWVYADPVTLVHDRRITSAYNPC